MKKVLAISIAILTIFTAVLFTGCGGDNTATTTHKTGGKVNTATLDRIRFFDSENDSHGALLKTAKGSDNETMSYMNQIISETKKTEDKDKEKLGKIKAEYFVELLNYEEDGTQLESNAYYLYILDNNKVYCYYPDSQDFSGTSYYINGYTNVTAEQIDKMINGD